ncbi:MAG: hypothetical protein PF549_02160 [Patescibacteria group bacterium]|nr:hypothetical protein [Patescibacteria group bacterium]
MIFSINQNSSIVVSKNKNLNRNLLGRADGLNVHVSDEIIQLMKCQKIEKLDNGVDFWKDFVQGDLANPREDYWRRIDSSTGMICAYDGNDFYLTMVTSSNDKIKNIEIKSDELNQKLDNPYYSWEEKGSNFYLYHSSFDKEVINNLSIIIKNNFIDSRKWPAKGKGRIIFDN